MNSFKVLSFVFIVFFAFISCSNHFNTSNDVETGSPLRMRRTLDSENDSDNSDRSSDEEPEPIVLDHPPPVITLKQYSASFKVNVLLLLLLEPSGKVIPALKPALVLSLIVNAINYFRTATSRSSPTISVERWLLTPLSWLTEIHILLSSEKEIYFFGDDGLSINSILYFIFFVQMMYYLSAFAP